MTIFLVESKKDQERKKQTIKRSTEEHFLTLLFETAPSLQIMFKSPKEVAAMRILKFKIFGGVVFFV